MHITRRSLLKWTGICISGLFGYSAIVEPRNLKITKIKLNFKNLPKKINKFTILHITDLHFGSTPLKGVYDDVLKVSKEIKSDMIVVTGDTISKRSALMYAEDFFSQLPNLPVFVVWGNWDHWSMRENIEELKRTLEKDGKTVILSNEAYEIEENFFIFSVACKTPCESDGIRRRGG